MSRLVRTQIHLSEDELVLLDAAAKATGASRSELIRRAVRERYGGEASLAERKARARRAFGAWKDRSFTGEEYVRAVRSGDMNENLRRLGA
jgi:metal-responsive CopG/Arc/MetJ family transcriptional regulator